MFSPWHILLATGILRIDCYDRCVAMTDVLLWLLISFQVLRMVPEDTTQLTLLRQLMITDNEVFSSHSYSVVFVIDSVVFFLSFPVLQCNELYNSVIYYFWQRKINCYFNPNFMILLWVIYFVIFHNKKWYTRVAWNVASLTD